MNLGKALVDLATAPARIGLAVADIGLNVATAALGMAQRTLGDTDSGAGPGSVAHLLGIASTPRITGGTEHQGGNRCN